MTVAVRLLLNSRKLLVACLGLCAGATSAQTTSVQESNNGEVTGIAAHNDFGTYGYSGPGGSDSGTVNHNTYMSSASYGDVRQTDTLTYSVTFEGPTSTVDVDFVGWMHGSGSIVADGDHVTWGGYMALADPLGNLLVNRCMGKECVPEYGSPTSISVSQVFEFQTGATYQVYLSLSTDGIAEPNANGPYIFALSQAWSDPSFTVLGADASEYTITYSPGIVPDVSAVPEPAWPLLMLAGLGLIGLVRRQRCYSAGKALA